MSDIFTEVDESLRQEKLQSLWKIWRPFVYGGVVLLIVGVAAHEFAVKPYLENQKAERALALETAVKALEDGQYAEAEAGLTKIMESDPRLAALAANFLAQTKFEGGGDAEGAAEVLARVGGTEGGPYERLALLKSAYFKADSLSLADLEATLGSLTEDDSALGALARELVAAKAYEAGDYARARTEFNRLRFDAAAPQGVVRRAEIALAAIPVPPEADAGAESDADGDVAPEAAETTVPAEAPEASAPQENGQ